MNTNHPVGFSPEEIAAFRRFLICTPKRLHPSPLNSASHAYDSMPHVLSELRKFARRVGMDEKSVVAGFNEARAQKLKVGDVVKLGQDGKMRKVAQDSPLDLLGGEEVDRPDNINEYDGGGTRDDHGVLLNEAGLDSDGMTCPICGETCDSEEGIKAHFAEAHPSGGAEDDPPPFSGRPRVGGEMDPLNERNSAMDAAMRIRSGFSVRSGTAQFGVHPTTRQKALMARDAKLGIVNGAHDAAARTYNSNSLASTFSRIPGLARLIGR